MEMQVCYMWMRGQRSTRNRPKPIGAYHRIQCNKTPCCAIALKRPFAMELVKKFAPNDTVTGGGPQWAAWAIRQIGDGNPTSLAEKVYTDRYDPEGKMRRLMPDAMVATPGSSVAGSETTVRGSSSVAASSAAAHVHTMSNERGRSEGARGGEVSVECVCRGASYGVWYVCS